MKGKIGGPKNIMETQRDGEILGFGHSRWEHMVPSEHEHLVVQKPSQKHGPAGALADGRNLNAGRPGGRSRQIRVLYFAHRRRTRPTKVLLCKPPDQTLRNLSPDPAGLVYLR